MASPTAISIPAAGRGKNYSNAELKQLCLSALHVSQDPAVGNEQRAEKFYHRVQDHYNQHRPKGGEARGVKSLESKWADIKHNVSKFQGCYNQVEERRTSGTNLEDTLIAAKELYKENHPKGKSFSFECAWNILKDCPCWKVLADDMAQTKNTKAVKRQRASAPMKEGKNGSPEILDTSDGDTDAATDSTVGNSDVQRPIGNKQAKEDNKRARFTKDLFRMTAEAQKEQATATTKMAKSNFMRARTTENNSTIALLSMPIKSFSPELRAFKQSWKFEEAVKLKQRMQSVSSHTTPPASEPAPPQAARNPLPCVRQPVFPVPATIQDQNQEGSRSIPDEVVQQAGRRGEMNIDQPNRQKHLLPLWMNTTEMENFTDL